MRDEDFFEDLQKVILRDRWIERMLYYYFGMGEMHSCEYMIKSLVKDFVQEFPKWSAYETSITAVVIRLKELLFDKLCKAKYIPDVNKIISVLENNTKRIEEKIDEKAEYIIQFIRTSDTITDGKYTEIVDPDITVGESVDNEEQERDYFSHKCNYAACQFIRSQDYMSAIQETDMLLSRYPDDIYGLYNSAMANYRKIVAEGNAYSGRHGYDLPGNNYNYSVVIDKLAKAFDIAGAEDLDLLNFYGFIMLISRKDIKFAEKLFFMCIGRSFESDNESALADAW